MTKTNKIIAAIVVVAVLVIGVGYAAIGNITLKIEGSAAAAPNDANFAVVLTGTPTVSSSDVVTSATVANDGKTAEFTVENLTAKGETATITYKVKNNSADLSASLSAATSNDNTEYFTVDYEFGKETITAGEETTVTVTVTVNKTPVSDSVSADVGVTITAQPIQPTV